MKPQQLLIGFLSILLFSCVQVSPEAEAETAIEIQDSMEDPFLSLHAELDVQIQKQSISSTKEQFLEFEQGTKIRIPANAFVFADNDEPVVGEVVIELKEYYLISDMLRADLVTMWNDQILDSRGMIWIGAKQGERELSIVHGKEIEVYFSSEEFENGFGLYDGVPDESGTINWQPAKDFNLAKLHTLDEVDVAPSFPGGSEALSEFTMQEIGYSKEAYLQKLSGEVIIGFVVERSGELMDFKVVKSVDPILDEAALNAARAMPRWIPGQLNGEAVDVLCELPANFELDEEVLGLPTDLVGGLQDGPINPKEIRANYEERRINKYIFPTKTLGWKNLDILAKFEGKRKDIRIPAECEFHKVKIVFHRYRSIVSSTRVEEELLLKNIPMNLKVTIVALKYMDEAYLLAKKEMILGEEGIGELNYEEADAQKLNEVYHALDEL